MITISLIYLQIAKEGTKYDTIIMTPSNNELNKIVFGYLIRLIRHDNHIEDFFEKMTADDVYSCMIDDNYIEQHYPNKANDIYVDIDDAFIAMNNTNDGIFSYKYLQKAEYRDIIIQSMRIKNYPHCKLNYENIINNKHVLVFDDTITTGKTISDSGKAIKDMFNPKSITYITLFSAIPKSNSQMQKVNNINNE